MQSSFIFGGRGVINIPPPAYPAGAAAFEHQKAMGMDVLMPTSASGSTGHGLNAAFMPAATAYRVWPCAQQLSEWLHASEAPPLTGRNCLELGAGCGLAGLSAWLAGAARVCLTDLPENLPRLEQLVQHNNAAPTVTCAALDWTSPLPQELACIQWHVVLAADCMCALDHFARPPFPVATTRQLATHCYSLAVRSFATVSGRGSLGPS